MATGFWVAVEAVLLGCLLFMGPWILGRRWEQSRMSEERPVVTAVTWSVLLEEHTSTMGNSGAFKTLASTNMGAAQ